MTKEVVAEVKEKTGVNLTQEQFNNLMARLNTLENAKQEAPQAAVQAPQGFVQGAQVTARGIVGTLEKYPINKKLYSDPRERLYSEKRLSRFGLRENYELYWSIGLSRYQTAQGTWQQEPRFELEIRKRQLDDDGKETGQYLIQKFVGHEDYDAAVDIATALGIEVDDNFGKEFIDEMRYQQMRMWIEEVFFPPKAIKNQNSGRKEMVVGGKVVTFYENPVDLNRDISGV